VIAAGFNATNAEMDATRHAEFVAADQILLGSEGRYDLGVFKECDLYVTCEPCLMCASALGHLGIRSVIFGCHNDKFGGCGSILHLHQPLSSHHLGEFESHRAAGGGSCYPVTSGVLKDEAVALFRRFYARANTRAPETKRKRKEDDDQTP
jgi:tRNA-specific adenosine deaminase 2